MLAKAVLLPDIIEPFHDISFNVDVQILGALHQQRLIDQIAQKVFLVFRNQGVDFFGRCSPGSPAAPLQAALPPTSRSPKA